MVTATQTTVDPVKKPPLNPLNTEASPGPAPTQPGLINSVASQAAPGPAQSFDTPTNTQVDAPSETVEARLNNLTAKDSKYVKLQQQDAMRSANSRGLINSTMAAGAGTEAAIRSALPIAQQDAKTYTDTRLNNQAATNQFEENRQMTELGKESASYETDLAKGMATHENDLAMGRDVALSDQRQDEDKNRAELNNATDALRSQLAKSEEAWSRTVQTNMEIVLADKKLSSDMKMSYVKSINDITLQAAQDINAISLSDSTAQAQAAAIKRIEEVRNANIAVYNNLLSASTTWDWGTGGAVTGGTNTTGVTPASGVAPSNTDLSALIPGGGGTLAAGGTGGTADPDVFNADNGNDFTQDYGPGTENDKWITDPVTGASGWGNDQLGKIDPGASGWFMAKSPDGGSSQWVYFDENGNPAIADWTKPEVQTDNTVPAINPAQPGNNMQATPMNVLGDSYDPITKKYTNNNLPPEINALANQVLGNDNWMNGNFNDDALVAKMGNFEENLKGWLSPTGTYYNPNQSLQVNDMYNAIISGVAPTRTEYTQYQQ